MASFASKILLAKNLSNVHHLRMKLKKKTPYNYGQFYFRISKEEQAELEQQIDEVLLEMVKKIKPDELKPKRNELLLASIRIGLKEIKKKLK